MLFMALHSLLCPSSHKPPRLAATTTATSIRTWVTFAQEFHLETLLIACNGGIGKYMEQILRELMLASLDKNYVTRPRPLHKINFNELLCNHFGGWCNRDTIEGGWALKTERRGQPSQALIHKSKTLWRPQTLRPDQRKPWTPAPRESLSAWTCWKNVLRWEHSFWFTEHLV